MFFVQTRENLTQGFKFFEKSPKIMHFWQIVKISPKSGGSAPRTPYEATPKVSPPEPKSWQRRRVAPSSVYKLLQLLKNVS